MSALGHVSEDSVTCWQDTSIGKDPGYLKMYGRATSSSVSKVGNDDETLGDIEYRFYRACQTWPGQVEEKVLAYLFALQAAAESLQGLVQPRSRALPFQPLS